MEHDLFTHMIEQHGLTLLESELEEIKTLCRPPKPYPFKTENEPELKWVFPSKSITPIEVEELKKKFENFAKNMDFDWEYTWNWIEDNCLSIKGEVAEIPSDEEIEREGLERFELYCEELDGYIAGAKSMRDKLTTSRNSSIEREEKE